MKSNKNKEEEMKAEYDFRGKKGVRGKYYEAMQKGHTTIIHKTDGSTVIKETKLIALAPDVQNYSPDAESVNGSSARSDCTPEKHNTK